MIDFQHQPGMECACITLIRCETDPRSVHELRAEVRCIEIASTIAREKGTCFPVRHDAAVCGKPVLESIAVDAGSHAGATEKIKIALIITAEPTLGEPCGVCGRE